MPTINILKRGADGPFSQQELQASQPLLTPMVITGIFLLVSLIFIPIGIVLLERSDASHYQRYRYDNISDCAVSFEDNNTQLPKQCTFTITVDNDMKAPIYFYYELENFYQNGRKYLSSKSDSQLRNAGTKNNGNCKPFMEYYNNKLLQPCGLIARSFFTDRFSIVVNGNNLCKNCVVYKNASQWKQNWDTWSEEPNWAIKGIAWPSDVNTKFQKGEIDNYTVTQVGWWQEKLGLRLPDVDNEDFIVWMRVAGLPSFRKLHRIIRERDLAKGDVIDVTVVAWYPVDHFKGEKWIGLGTATWAGMENYVLAWGLIITSIICIGMALLFAIFLLFGTRKLADMHRFQWKNRPVSTAIVSIADN